MILVTKFAQKLQQVVDAIGKFFPAKSTITLLGKTYTGAQLAAAFQAGLTALQAVTTAKSGLAQAVAACKAQLGDVRSLYAAFGEALRSQFGHGNPIVGEFGFPTGARSKPSPEKLVAGKNQAKATREARHTLGKKQRAKITAPAPTPAPVTGGNGTPPGASGTGPA